MISKKYTAEYKINAVKEYLDRAEKENISKAIFASEKGIPDSTFNDWVIKYERDQVGFCNVTNEIIKLDELSVVETKGLIRKVEDSEEIQEKDMIRMTYNGAILEFHEIFLERVLKILKEW